MNIRKYVLLIASAVMGIGFAGNLMAIDFPGFDFGGTGGSTGGGSVTTSPGGHHTLFTCNSIGNHITDTGSSSCESSGSGSSSCSSSSTDAGSRPVTAWESTNPNYIDADFNGSCVEVMKHLGGNCTFAYDKAHCTQ